MKKLLAIAFLATFVVSVTDAIPLTHYFSAEYKCPRCKMKMERFKDCPCHKKKSSAPAVIHDPCGDDGNDYSVHFDHLTGIFVTETARAAKNVALRSAILPPSLISFVADILAPPPRA